MRKQIADAEDEEQRRGGRRHPFGAVSDVNGLKPSTPAPSPRRRSPSRRSSCVPPRPSRRRRGRPRGRTRRSSGPPRSRRRRRRSRSRGCCRRRRSRRAGDHHRHDPEDQVVEVDAAVADDAARPPGHLRAAHQPRAHPDEGEGEQEADQDQEEALELVLGDPVLEVGDDRGGRLMRAPGSTGRGRCERRGAPFLALIRSTVRRTAATAKTGARAALGHRLGQPGGEEGSGRRGRGRGRPRAPPITSPAISIGPAPRRPARSRRGPVASCGARPPHAALLELHQRAGEAEPDEGQDAGDDSRRASPAATIATKRRSISDQPAVLEPPGDLAQRRRVLAAGWVREIAIAPLKKTSPISPVAVTTVTARDQAATLIPSVTSSESSSTSWSGR